MISTLPFDCWTTEGLLESLQRNLRMVQPSGSQPSLSGALYIEFFL